MITVDFKRAGVPQKGVVLDLGCGEGRHCHGLAHAYPELTVIGIDAASTDIRTARQRHHGFDPEAASRTLYSRADGFSLPLADRSIDHVICSEVLEHIVDDQGFLREMHRVLKPGGGLSISVPRRWPEKVCWKLRREYYEVEGGHVRIYRAKSLRRAIETLGYQFRQSHHAHALHAPFWWLRCAFWHRGESFGPVRFYHRLLVWDLLKRPWLTRGLEALLNPLVGKSVVMYFKKRGTHEG